MGFKMNYGNASDNGFKGTMEHGARAFQSDRVAEQFMPYPGTGTSTGYGVTFMRPTNEKGSIPLDNGEIKIMSISTTVEDTSLIRME